MLRAPSEGEDIVADHASTGLTLGRHPLALLRERLACEGIRSAATLRDLPHGAPVHVAGLVIVRQRPGSAGGTVFVTLEDETGQLNLVIRRQLALRQRRILLQARLMGVRGRVQHEGGRLQVLAGRLEDHSRLLGSLPVPSRDFH